MRTDKKALSQPNKNVRSHIKTLLYPARSFKAWEKNEEYETNLCLLVNTYLVLTLLFLMLPFDPPEDIRKQVLWCFQGDQKRTLEIKGLTR